MSVKTLTRISVAASSLTMLVGAAASGATIDSSGVAALRAPQSSPAHHSLRPLPPADHFVRRVDNPLLPWLPGSRWVYRSRGSDGPQRIVVRVLRRTKVIEGITATVVRDVVRHGGKLVEKTFDWYGQDLRGNVWYLGEATKAYEHGHVDTEGSWQAGVHGAKAGIAMFGHPRVGVTYRQEFLAGHAEDQAKALDLSTQVGVPFGHFRRVLMTDETTALEPRGNELKFYARGIGDVLELDLSPHQGRTVLVRMSSTAR